VFLHVGRDGDALAYEDRGPEGKTSELVKDRVRSNYMIVDRLFAAAELRFGNGNSQKRVRIVRTDGRPAS
jgi:type IV secretory pathway VirB9-like protein